MNTIQCSFHKVLYVLSGSDPADLHQLMQPSHIHSHSMRPLWNVWMTIRPCPLIGVLWRDRDTIADPPIVAVIDVPERWASQLGASRRWKNGCPFEGKIRGTHDFSIVFPIIRGSCRFSIQILWWLAQIGFHLLMLKETQKLLKAS